MKVFINALSLKPRMGGGLTFGLGLARALHQSAGAHEVVLLGHDGNAELLQTSGCPVSRTAGDLGNPARRVLFENTALPGRVSQLGADIYVSLDGIVSSRMNPATVAILQNALYFNRSQVLTAGELSGGRRVYLNLQARYFLSGWRRTARYADACVFVSDSLRTEFVARFPAMSSKSHVVWEAPDPAFKPGASTSGVSPYLLGVGTLYPYKRFDVLIRLLRELSDIPALRARIAGPNWGREQERLVKLARDVGVEERIDFLGHQSEAQLLDLYRGALCFCMFSDFEAFGLPLVEALACGVPTLAVHRSAMPEIGQDAIFTAEPGDVVPYAGHIRRLLQDRGYCEQWSAKALGRSGLFRWGAIAALYWQLFGKLQREHGLWGGEKTDVLRKEEIVS